MEAANARQFFETLESRAADSSKVAGLNATYLFDIDGAGKWTVRIDDGKVDVDEGDAEGTADATISASEETFMKVVRGDQNATSAFMMGKLRVKGDMGKAMKLQQLF